MSLFKSLFGGGPENVQKLKAAEFLEAVKDKKQQLVDVRTPSEFAAGHIDGAINIDFFQQNVFAQKFEKMDKTKPVYIYCKSGGRSGNASKILADMGFVMVYDLIGGYSRL